MDLRSSEIRVLGCLLEKQRTTPDLYPLTLNSLRLACNQSTNRDPVVSYQDSDVKDALHRLERRGFARFAGGAGSRAPKYRHLLAEALPMDDAEQAVMCVMMLRGPQTPGELKQRCERMHPFADLAAVHHALERLMGRDLAVRLPRRPGQKEERYAHTLGGEEDETAGASSGAAASGASGAAAAGLAAVPDAAGGSHWSGANGSTQSPAGGLRGTGSVGASVDVEPALESAPEAQVDALEAQVERLGARVATLERELRDLQAQLGVGPT